MSEEKTYRAADLLRAEIENQRIILVSTSGEVYLTRVTVAAYLGVAEGDIDLSSVGKTKCEYTGEDLTLTDDDGDIHVDSLSHLTVERAQQIVDDLQALLDKIAIADIVAKRQKWCDEFNATATPKCDAETC